MKCDKCHKDFPIKIKEKKHGLGVVEAYFKCPYCKKHYTSFVTDAEIRSEQRAIKHTSSRALKEMTEEEAREHLAEIHRLKAALKPKMDKLKDKIIKASGH